MKNNSPFFKMVVLTLLYWFYSVLCYPWNLTERKPLTSAQAIDAASSTNLDSSIHITRNRFTKIRDYLVLIWTMLVQLMMKYAYLISLVVLYICGLQEVNILNSIFCIFGFHI